MMGGTSILLQCLYRAVEKCGIVRSSCESDWLVRFDERLSRRFSDDVWGLVFCICDLARFCDFA